MEPGESSADRGRPAPGHPDPRHPDPGAWPHLAGSLLGHLAFLMIAARLSAPLGEVGSDRITEDLRFAPFPPVSALAEPPDEEEDPHARTLALHDPDDEEPAESRCGELRGGSMGNPTAGRDAHRYGVQGPEDNPDPHLARTASTRSTWFVPYWAGPSEGDAGGDAHAPIAVWGRDDSLGTDAESARGHLFGETFGESRGSPGVGLGLSVLCDTCGATGMGAALRGTAPDGPVGTELSGRTVYARAVRSSRSTAPEMSP